MKLFLTVDVGKEVISVFDYLNRNLGVNRFIFWLTGFKDENGKPLVDRVTEFKYRHPDVVNQYKDLFKDVTVTINSKTEVIDFTKLQHLSCCFTDKPKANVFDEVEFVTELPMNWKKTEIVDMESILLYNRPKITKLKVNSLCDDVIFTYDESKEDGYIKTHSEGSDGSFPIRVERIIKEKLESASILKFYSEKHNELKIKNIAHTTEVFNVTHLDDKYYIRHPTWNASKSVKDYILELMNKNARIDDVCLEYQARKYFISALQAYFL